MNVSISFSSSDICDADYNTIIGVSIFESSFTLFLWWLLSCFYDYNKQCISGAIKVRCSNNPIQKYITTYRTTVCRGS